MARSPARSRGFVCVPTFAVAPAITGTAKVGQTLTSAATVARGAITGRQWRRGGVAISGATAATYVVQSADVGQTITVAVTAAGSLNAANTVTAVSAPTVAAVA